MGVSAPASYDRLLIILPRKGSGRGRGGGGGSGRPGPMPGDRECRPYITGCNLSSSFWPPANDAAEEHKQAAVPDKRCQRVDENADGRLRAAIPVGQEDIYIGQAKGRDGDQAGRLVIKVPVENTARIDIALQLAVTPDL